MVPRNEEQYLRRPPNSRLLSIQSYVSKRSFRSHSSSFEADDERSTTTTDESGTGRMSPSGSERDESRYHGEDTRATSKKELNGWYMYAFAAEVYVICAISSFIPILLETLARENGVLLSDRSSPCPSSDSTSTAPDGKKDQCIVSILGVDINTASFAMYTFSVSVLLQALLVVSISCAADHGHYRKRLLLMFGWIGGICTMCFVFVSREIYVLGAFLAIISNTSFGASFVLLNSFLPLLVRYHPRVLYAEGVLPDDTGSDAQPDENSSIETEGALSGSTARALPSGDTASDIHILTRTSTKSELTSLELELSTQISSKGIGIGYGAGVFAQCIAIMILIAMKSSTWSQRVVLLFVGSWWTVFTIPAAMWLRPRPGPPLPQTQQKGRLAWLSYIVYAWKNLYRTIKLARRLLDIVLFLGAWFLLSDAIATMGSTAILFAKTTLHMKPWALGLISVISTTAGVMGAFSWSLISRRLKLQPHKTILACIALFELIPIYGLLGYLPFVQRWGFIGLQAKWEMYPLGAVYGFVLGGLSSYCRSLYGELIPPGSEAAFYALYAITDKGSSVFGPAIVGAIIDRYGEIRPAFWFLALLVGLPAPLIYFVNVERGKAEGEKLAMVIEGFKSNEAREDHAGDHRTEEREGMLAGYEREAH